MDTSITFPRQAFASQREKDFCLEVVRKYSKEINDRKNDVKSIERKRRVWERIEYEYNSDPNVTQRSIAQIKKLWSNHKQAKRLKNIKSPGEGETDTAMKEIDQNSFTPHVISVCPSQIIPPATEDDDEEYAAESSNPEMEIDHKYIKTAKNVYMSLNDTTDDNSTRSNKKEEIVIIRKEPITQEEILENEIEEHQLRVKVLRTKLRHMEHKFNAEMKNMRELHELEILQSKELHKARMEKLK